MDSVSATRRSEIMGLVKSKNTSLEIRVQIELKRRGYRFKTHFSKLPGKPDIVFLKNKIAIFIDSCFWHGCKLHCRLPKSNKNYWKQKIERNKKRDRAVNRRLKMSGWQPLRFWEHTLKKNPDRFFHSLKNKINSIA